MVTTADGASSTTRIVRIASPLVASGSLSRACARCREVFLAADELLDDPGSRPTVTAVRAHAGCSNADATLFLRERRAERAEQAAADADVPAMPDTVEQLAARNAAALRRAPSAKPPARPRGRPSRKPG